MRQKSSRTDGRANEQKDLLVYVADSDIKATMESLLKRPEALEIRPITYEVKKHVATHAHGKGDSGCFRTSHDYLREVRRDFSHAIVMFDHHGSGAERHPHQQLEEELEKRLLRTGWAEDTCLAICLAPELECWIWCHERNVAHVAQLACWDSRSRPPLRQWLIDTGLWPDEAPAPRNPKKVLENILAEVDLNWSQAIHSELAKRISLKHCTEPSFTKLRATLQSWFPA